MSKVPRLTSNFIGREEISSKMQNHVFGGLDNQSQIVLLHGLGGAGKTQTALKFAQKWEDKCAFYISFFQNSVLQTNAFVLRLRIDSLTYSLSIAAPVLISRQVFMILQRKREYKKHLRGKDNNGLRHTRTGCSFMTMLMTPHFS